MAISYAANAFKFVDSQYGTASGNDIKKLVPVITDRMFHKQVQTKILWKKLGLIGEDTYNEGGNSETAPGFPIIRKTQLEVEQGDTIKMGLLTNLDAGVNTGKTGATQLVDAEAAFTFKNFSAKIERLRNGVRTDAGMNKKRNPYKSFEEIEQGLLEDWAAQFQDTSVLYAMHYGYAPHMFREGGTGATAYPPTACPNALYGNDLSTSRTVADLATGTTDVFKANTIEIARTFMTENHFDPIIVNGKQYFAGVISNRARYYFRQDNRFFDAMKYAMERGIQNPIFSNADLVFDNVILFTYEKIRTILAGKNPAGLTVSGTITEADYTGIGGGWAASDLQQAYFFGANAVAIAESDMRGNLVRKEDDYENIIGRAVDMIFGVSRIDWVTEAGATPTNQGLLLMVNPLGSPV
jgi:N4-gp56 family major capsid protein